MTKRSVIRITKNLQGLAESEEQHDKFVKNDASAIKCKGLLDIAQARNLLA